MTLSLNITFPAGQAQTFEVNIPIQYTAGLFQLQNTFISFGTNINATLLNSTSIPTSAVDTNNDGFVDVINYKFGNVLAASSSSIAFPLVSSNTPLLVNFIILF